MKTIRLGRTNVEVPSLAVGTWGHGGPQTVGRIPVGWSGHDDRAALAALRRAFETGLTHWDTADVYGRGRAEQLIGSLWGDLDRSTVFLASKVGWDPGPYDHYYHPKQIDHQLQQSLTNLATDMIDLYYLHHCDFGPDDRYLDDAIDRLQRYREAGRIRFIGLSDWSSERLLRVADHVDPDVIQPYRNVVDDTWESSGLKEWAEAHDVGVAFFSPLKHGLLLGRYENPPQFPEGDHRRRIKEFRDPERLGHYRHCRAAVERRFPDHPEPVLHALLGSLMSDAANSCVLLGMRRPEHVEAARTAGDRLALADSTWVKTLYQRG